MGDHVFFDNATGRPNRLLTFGTTAVITIGDGSYLNGVEVICASHVEIGEKCIIAECLVMDTDFHATEIDRHGASAKVKTASVRIGRNVWIANKTIIIRGVTIGENSVVGAGAVVTRDVPPNCIVAGNPAKVVRHLSTAGELVSRE